ncbi:MAG: carbon-nitrogen hydrolase family protein [Thermoanaerobaculales bacterium]|jgi:predicted amidohydrolase|nr:carbon-nitrogen hydrolase family protein [Thermoanaerobaculales bacterium]
MSPPSLTVALITETYADRTGPDRLARRLAEARRAGAGLAVLPELPLDRWAPADREPRDGDAEPPGGPRQRAMAEAAASAGIALLGGAIVRDPATGRRHNTALLIDAAGGLVSSYRKIHLPFEEGFWEAAHYAPGDQPPVVMTGLALALGVQICSDANRTSGCQLLAAQGAAVIAVPRATPAASWPRWRLVLRADAVTSALWVVTVNRPPESVPSPIGGASAVIAPDGEVLVETTDPLAVVELDGAAVARARAGYPGYLGFRPAVHARGWTALAD